MKLKLLLATASLLVSSLSQATGNQAQFKVTVTNLTQAQAFTPILVSSHRWGVHIFNLGEPASTDLAALAEGGDIAPLQSSLMNDHRVIDTNSSEGLLEPGKSVSILVKAPHKARRISLASMLIPTNDSFIALDNVAVPRGHGKRTYWVPAYDAGSETNDELCLNIPGPVCGGAGGSPESDGEGFVHISNGIHGQGDLNAGVYDWRNPAARVTIQRMK
ncbi:MAG: spondin domain-containing protein [Gammaproteobacteria bacterium]